MQHFKITVRETFEKDLFIRANSLEEATRIVDDNYSEDFIHLYKSDFKNVDYICDHSQEELKKPIDEKDYDATEDYIQHNKEAFYHIYRNSR